MREGGGNPAFFCLRRSARGFYSAKRRPGPARLRRLCVLRRLFLSSSLPLAVAFSFRPCFTVSLFPLFFLRFRLLIASGRRFFSSPFPFRRARPFLGIAAKKETRERKKKMEEKAPGPALSKINCSPRGRSIRIKEAAGAGAFRALRKAKPRDVLAAHPQALGAARLDAVWGVSTPRADFAPPQLKSKNPPSLWAHGQGCGPCPSFGQIGSIAESQQNSCRGPH